MSTRDELRLDVHRALMPRAMTILPALGGEQRHYDGFLDDLAEALLAAGWRKMPSRDEMAKAIFELRYHSMHWLDAREPERDDYRNRADQILALMDGGQ